MRLINNIKIYYKENDESKKVYDILLKELIDYNFKIVENNFDLVISIGGDGTFLKMIHENKFDENIYYIGINTGTLGFLPEIEVNNITDFIDNLNSNKFEVDELCYIKTKVTEANGIDEYNSLNEIVIRQNELNVLRGSINIDNCFLESFIGDGLVLSTPTGSTAYNMSLNGPIIDNSLNVLSIMPIAPINNHVFNTLPNTLIIAKDKKVSLVFNNNDIILLNDGKKSIINGVCQIDCEISNSIKCIRMVNYHFIDAISKKIIG